MQITDLTNIPDNAVPFQPDNNPDIPNGISHVEKADLFYNWMDETYDTDNIVLTAQQFADWTCKPFGHKGTYFTTALTSTVPDMNKTGNPFHGHLRKVTSAQLLTGPWSYMNAVNNARMKLASINDGPIFLDGEFVPPMEDDAVLHFEPRPRKWGTRLVGLPLIVHTKHGETHQRHYLAARPIRWHWNQFFIDGELATNDDHLVWLKDKDEANRKQAKHQGLTVDTMVHERDYTISNIVNARYGNRTLWLNHAA